MGSSLPNRILETGFMTTEVPGLIRITGAMALTKIEIIPTKVEMVICSTRMEDMEKRTETRSSPTSQMMEIIETSQVEELIREAIPPRWVEITVKETTMIMEEETTIMVEEGTLLMVVKGTITMVV